MSGGLDPLYVRARRTLLDALVALRGQRDAVILVEAQAIYLHFGEADFAVAAFTSDADLALNPAALHPDPTLIEAMHAAGFQMRASQIGTWVGNEGIDVDLMVPELVGGGGRRGARLGVHGNTAARKTRGLEAALVDKREQVIASLEGDDERRIETSVSGPAALLVAKLHKIEERRDNEGRRSDKDALDIYRLLRASDMQDLANTLDALRRDNRCGEVTRAALEHLGTLFGQEQAVGAQMAMRAVESLVGDPAEIAASCAVLTQDLLAELAEIP